MINAQVKERPILFSAPMVRAILEDRKTQTRRIMKPQPQLITGSGKRVYADSDFKKSWQDIPGTGEGSGYPDCPHGEPGHRLWVRESFFWDGPRIAYRADHEGYAPKDTPWKPSIYMPRAASRILLEITDVRAERLAGISEADAIAEGVEKWPDGNYKAYGKHAGKYSNARDSFFSLWQDINGTESLQQNPFVWAINFKRIN